MRHVDKLSFIERKKGWKEREEKYNIDGRGGKGSMFSDSKSRHDGEGGGNEPAAKTRCYFFFNTRVNVRNVQIDGTQPSLSFFFWRRAFLMVLNGEDIVFTALQFRRFFE